MALKHRFLGIAFALLASPGLAQQAKIAFGELSQDTTLPVEVAAEQFAINNADGTAVFSGGVTVKQGEMTLSAAEVRVTYTPEGNAISQLVASGGVSISNLADTAQSDEALYTIDSGVIVLTGNVRLTQGPSALAGQKLTISLKDGSGIMEGGVTTTFVPGGN